MKAMRLLLGFVGLEINPRASSAKAVKAYGGGGKALACHTEGYPHLITSRKDFLSNGRNDEHIGVPYKVSNIEQCLIGSLNGVRRGA